MGTKLTSQTMSGYNSSPPSDDGTASEANRVTWAKHKNKLTDPIKQFVEDIETALLVHVNENLSEISANTTTTAANHKQTFNVTGAYTISLGDASTMGTGYLITVKNSHTSAITISRATGGDTIDGTAADISLHPGNAMTFVTNATPDGYHKIAEVNLGYFEEDVTMEGTLDVIGAGSFTDDLDVGGSLNVEAYSEDADQTATGGAITLNTSLATYFHTQTLASIPTFTFSNPASSGRVTSFILELNNAVGYAPVWPASVEWPEGTEPTWSTGTDLVSFITRDGGTTWFGMLGGSAFA